MKYSHDIAQKMVELRRAGMVFWRIGAQLGVPQGSVMRWIAKYEGLQRRENALRKAEAA
jgi:transposase-like protein